MDFLLIFVFVMNSIIPSMPISYQNHKAKEWVGGDEATAKPQVFMTQDFGPLTLANFGGIGPAAGGVGEHGKWFKVKTSSCALDGMRIHSDFSIGSWLSSSHLNISSCLGGGKCGRDGDEDETEIFIELDDNDALGIKVNLRRCLKHDLGGILMEHNIRIEDQAGWLIEKFFFKILQNVDMHAIMNEEKKRENSNLRWICIPEQDLVSMDSGFSLMGLMTGVQTNIADSKSKANLVARWTAISEDGMIVTTNVTVDYGQCESKVDINGDEDDSTAEVTINLDDKLEWTLSVEISECINGSANGNGGNEWFASKSMRFRAKMDIKEGSIYGRLLVVARQYVKKKNLKSDKLKEILGEI